MNCRLYGTNGLTEGVKFESLSTFNQRHIEIYYQNSIEDGTILV